MIKAYNISRLFFFVTCFLISITGLKFYEGSKLIFIFYNLILLILIFYLTNLNTSFINYFTGIYIFLGFWFKYIASLIFANGYMYYAGVDSVKNIDEVLVISIYIFFSLIFINYFSKKFFIYNRGPIKLKNNFFNKFYKNNKLFIIFFFIFIFSITGIYNFKFDIFIRGFIIENNLNLIFENLIKWLLIYGLTTFGCIILHKETVDQNKNLIFFIILIFFEIFFSYSSMMSRAMILTSFPIILAILNYQKKILNFKIFFILTLLIFLFFSYLSSMIANKERLKLFSSINDEKKINNLINEKYKYESPISIITKNLDEKDIQVNESPSKVNLFIFVNRWVGLDSLINVHFSNNQSFKLFFDSFSEKKKKVGKTFYEKNFFIKINDVNISSNNRTVKGNTLPGMISFLYYSGNIFFVIIIFSILIFLLNYLEKKLFKLTQNNLFFIAFCSHMIVFRLFNFGYAPRDSYLFILSIIFSIFVVYFLNSSKLDKIFSTLK